MTFAPPTVADFEAYFDRGFPYGPGKESIRPSDVQRALDAVPPVFNATIWTDTEATQAYLFAAAHFLVLDIQTAGGLGASEGLDSRGQGIIQQNSVGQVSVSYAIPEKIQNDPILNQFMQTGYGQRYLQMITPRLVGNMAVVSGRAPWSFT